MKLCLLIPSLVAGGAERVMTHMANYWADRGFDIHIITLDSPKNTPFYDLSAKVKLIQLDLLGATHKVFKPFLILNQIFSVLKTVLKIKPKALIAFLDISIFIALIIKPFLKTKVIVSERNNPFLNETNAIIKYINHFLYRTADQLILQTKEIVPFFPQHLHRKITVIPNPVLKSAVEKLEYDSDKNEFTMISVGRLKKQKGYDFLIKAFSSLGEVSRNWSLTIIGEGVERSALESLCKSMRLGTKVRLIGNKHNPENMMKDADIYILSSRFEGFPNSLCEAMSVGLPCIATRCQFGPQEIIDDGINGLLVDVDNENDLQLAITKLIDSKELREQLGEEAKKISDRLSLPNIMSRWEKVVMGSNVIKQ